MASLIKVDDARLNSCIAQNLAIFSKTVLQFCLIFCMTVEGYNYNTRKVMQPDFLTKIWFDPNCPKLAFLGLKLTFFLFFSKMVHYFFLIFCMKVEDHNAKKKWLGQIFRKKILFGPNSPKWSIFGPKIDFYIYFSNVVH